MKVLWENTKNVSTLKALKDWQPTGNTAILYKKRKNFFLINNSLSATMTLCMCTVTLKAWFSLYKYIHIAT